MKRTRIVIKELPDGSFFIKTNRDEVLWRVAKHRWALVKKLKHILKEIEEAK